LGSAVPAKIFIWCDSSAAFLAIRHLDERRITALFVDSKTLEVGTLFHDMKSQKRLSNYDFVAVTQRCALPWRESLAPIDKSSICRAQILEKVLTVGERDSCMPARNLGFGVIGVEINVGKDSAIRIPPTDMRLNIVKHELFAT
jgi:hypothetical protein